MRRPVALNDKTKWIRQSEEIAIDQNVGRIWANTALRVNSANFIVGSRLVRAETIGRTPAAVRQ